MDTGMTMQRDSTKLYMCNELSTFSATKSLVNVAGCVCVSQTSREDCQLEMVHRPGCDSGNVICF